MPVESDLVVPSVPALRTCARAGMGPAFLPDWLVRDGLRVGRLVDCLPDHQATATDFAAAAWLVYPSRACRPQKVRVTIDSLRRHRSVPTA